MSGESILGRYLSRRVNLYVESLKSPLISSVARLKPTPPLIADLYLKPRAATRLRSSLSVPILTRSATALRLTLIYKFLLSILLV